jgi:hypothetical protein
LHFFSSNFKDEVALTATVSSFADKVVGISGGDASQHRSDPPFQKGRLSPGDLVPIAHLAGGVQSVLLFGQGEQEVRSR